MVTINLTSPQPISIKKDPTSGREEVVIIELQGNIESDKNDSLVGETVGELEWDGIDNKPILVIGTHKLLGQLVTLNPPLAFIHRVNPTQLSDQNTPTGYQIRAIITQKLKFTIRPTIIVETESNPAC